MGLGQGDHGYAMAALLVGLSVMAVLMSAAMPVWSQYTRREKEEELIWRGNQYARAIGLFQRKYANTFPPNVDVLVQQKFLRKKYKDPITGEDFQPIPATGVAGGGVVAPPGMPALPGQPQQGSAVRQPSTSFSSQQRSPAQMTSVGTGGQGGIGIQGVVSTSDKTSIKIYNGRTKYNEWAFVYLAASQRITPGGPPQPGVGGRPGMPGQRTPGADGFTRPGTDRRPGAGFPQGGPPTAPGMQPGGRSPFGAPSPFGQPQPQPPPPRRPPG